MPKQTIGIAFDPPHLTLVQLTGTAKAYTVTCAEQHTLPQHADPEEQAALQLQALQELVATRHLRADTIVTTLPAHRAVLRNLEVPFKDARRIRPTLKYAMEDHMPFEPDDVIVDFHMTGPPTASASPLLVTAVPHEVIAEHLALFQGGDLEPTIIDLDVFALANAALLGYDALETSVILVDVQTTRTLLTFLHQGVPIFARSLAHNGLAEPALAISAERLSKQLQHTLYACENARKQPYEPDVLLLSGESTAQLGVLAPTLEKDLSLPTRLWRMTNERYKPGKVPFPAEDQVRYVVAFGAAARGLQRQAVGVNLRRERFELHRDIQELRGRLIGLGVMLMLVAGLGICSLYLNNRFKAQRYEQLQTEIKRVFAETFPNTRIVQPTAQMRDKIREFEERLRAFGGASGAQLSGLQILREVSARIPASITVNVDNLTITTDTIDLSGTTTSYDDVVKLKTALEASSVFPRVQINNTKADADSKIAFKLTITTAKQQEATS
jgi:Tfp pilus assembly PilM family ATPase/Tfp pilus assembly protein PilN